jgi:hypothetical protein
MSEAWHVEREGVACGKTCLEDRNNFSTVWNNSSGQNVAELRRNGVYRCHLAVYAKSLVQARPSVTFDHIASRRR